MLAPFGKQGQAKKKAEPINGGEKRLEEPYASNGTVEV
jgi:hypothetical protein